MRECVRASEVGMGVLFGVEVGWRWYGENQSLFSRAG